MSRFETSRFLSAIWLAFVALAALCVVSCAARPPALRVGMSGDYAPFTAESNGEPSGLDVDLARRFADDEGRRAEIVRFAWPELEERVAGGEFDVAMSGVTMRPERALTGRYTRPYAETGAVALIRAADRDRLRHAGDLDRPNVRLSVNRGGHLERVARRLFARAAITTVSDNRAQPARLRANEVDAVITDSAEAHAWQGDDVLAVGPFTSDHKAFLLPADRAALAASLDRWIVDRESDGWLAARRAAWLGADEPSDAGAATRRAIVALIALRTRLMPLVAAAKRESGAPIEDPAQERRVIDRIRDAAGANADGAARVYRALIEIAKAVQRDSAVDAGPSLPALRDAIGRIDEQIVREIGRLPPTREAEWAALLERGFDVPGIDAPLRTELASALAAAAH